MSAGLPCRSSCATAAPTSPSSRASPTRSSPTANRRAPCSASRPPSAPAAPQIRVEVNRVKAQTLHVSVDQVFTTLATYLGSTYIEQFNKFGRVFQVYAQADAPFRLRPRDIDKLEVRNQQGHMIPLGTVVDISPTVGPSLIIAL